MHSEEAEDIDMDNGEEMEGEDDPSSYFTQPTREEREALRAKYRNLWQVEDGKDISSLTLSQLKDRTLIADELFREVNTTQEAALDHKALVDLSNAAAKKIKQMRVDGGTFDVEDYMGNLMTRLRRAPVQEDGDDPAAGGDLDWFALGKVAGKWLRRAPTMDFL
ncbi:nuclear protein [Rhizophlyctis rosea]|nr:nuclear protein [Rhizophlyctis rosea]